MLPHYNSSQEVRTERNLKPGANAEAVEVYYLLACLAYFLIEPRTTCPAMAPPIKGWALPHWSLIKEVLQLDIIQAFPQLRLLPL